jgi:hypothetical protein
MAASKIKKFDELSKDIEDKDLEMDIEKLKKGGFEIESIIDVFHDPKDIEIKENIIGIPSDLSKKELSRGDTIYITALIKKKGVSFSSPATQAVLKVRIVDIYHGLSYLNKVLNQ